MNTQEDLTEANKIAGGEGQACPERSRRSGDGIFE
jgi:hypothetical protein